MKFNHLNVPDHWRQYWTRYPEGYTILEALINWVGQVDDMVDNVNNWNEYLDDFVELFDKELQGNVITILREWQEDGTLDVLIDEALQTQMDNLEEKISDISINVKTFGAVGDGVTDDTQAIQNAADYAFENGLVLGGRGTFLTTQTLKLRGNVDLSGVTILFNGTGTSVEYGSEAEKTRDILLKLPTIQKITRTWTNDIGVDIINTAESQIYVSKITDFGVGFQASAYGMGAAYNTVYLTHLENNEVNFKLKVADETGWVNENLIIGGRFSHFNTNDSHLENVSHMVFDAVEGAQYQPNNNVFLKPSLEGHIPYYTAIIFGSNNTIINGRYEGQGTQRIKFKDLNGIGSNHNLILNGYDSNLLEIESDPLSVRNSIETPLFSKTVGSNASGGIVNLQNKIGDSGSLIKLFSAQQDINNPNDYVVDWTANELKIKARTDAFPKFIINSNGRFYLGDGTAVPTNYLQYNASGTVVEGGIFLYNHSWENNLIRLGNYRLWVDTTGKLRIKSGHPQSDTDGSVVGSQT